MDFGPEPDRVYIGVSGKVLRVTIKPDGSAGPREDYLAVPACTGVVDGMTFDLGRNLYVGCPDPQTLFIAPYAAAGATAVAKSYANVPMDQGRNISIFTNPVFGTKAFGETNLYWTNVWPGRTVGRLAVGVPGLPRPLAP
jgi:hypothetical protein